MEATVDKEHAQAVALMRLARSPRAEDVELGRNIAISIGVLGDYEEYLGKFGHSPRCRCLACMLPPRRALGLCECGAPACSITLGSSCLPCYVDTMIFPCIDYGFLRAARVKGLHK